MKKIVAFMGTARKKATWQAVQQLEAGLKQYAEYDFEYVFLDDYRLEFCRGCKLCLDKGQEFCPLQDDRDILLRKMEQADGVIFATPNYAFQVSARMKNLLDRFAYVFHRPAFFGKVCTAIVTQGAFGGKGIAKYLQAMGVNFGFTVSKGAWMTTLEPMTQNQQAQMRRKVGRAAARFHHALTRSVLPSPSLFRLMMFRITRTVLKRFDLKFRDYYYYQEKGWLESDYYYAASLGPVKKAAGLLFDFLGRLIARQA